MACHAACHAASSAATRARRVPALGSRLAVRSLHRCGRLMKTRCALTPHTPTPSKTCTSSSGAKTGSTVKAARQLSQACPSRVVLQGRAPRVRGGLGMAARGKRLGMPARPSRTCPRPLLKTLHVRPMRVQRSSVPLTRCGRKGDGRGGVVGARVGWMLEVGLKRVQRHTIYRYHICPFPIYITIHHNQLSWCGSVGMSMIRFMIGVLYLRR